MRDELAQMFRDKLESDAVAGKFPGPDDPVFAEGEVPSKEETSLAMVFAKVPPQLRYAFEKTGFMLFEETTKLLSDRELAEWDDALNEYWGVAPPDDPRRRVRFFTDAHMMALAEASGRLTAMGPAGLAKELGIRRRVFLVHGHDEVNTLRLQRLLEDSFLLQVVVLNAKPGKGQTIIEKFEREASGAEYAFAMFTPDDLVASSAGSYRQMRPNVLFEVGWFCGRLGRDRVCIVHDRKTRIPSDLAGISRLEFDRDVRAIHEGITRELREVGLA